LFWYFILKNEINEQYFLYQILRAFATCYRKKLMYRSRCLKSEHELVLLWKETITLYIAQSVILGSVEYISEPDQNPIFSTNLNPDFKGTIWKTKVLVFNFIKDFLHSCICFSLKPLQKVSDVRLMRWKKPPKKFKIWYGILKLYFHKIKVEF